MTELISPDRLQRGSSEIWLPVPFALAYQASSHGNIIGVRGALLHPTKTDRDYLVCDLHKVQYRVNRIICWTFYGEPPSIEHQAAHKDSNSLNNAAYNLYWATALQNADDLYKTGKTLGENSHMAKLTEAQVRYIKEQHANGKRMADLHREFDFVEYVTISQIIHGRSWRHIR